MSTRRFANAFRISLICATPLGVVAGVWPHVSEVLFAFPGLATLALLLGWRRAWPGVESAHAGVQLPTHRESMPNFEREMGRARRYEHALGVIVLRAESASSSNGNGAFGGADRSPRTVGMMLRGSVRETDLLAWEPADGTFVLLVPETDRVQVEALSARLLKIVQARTGVTLRAGTAAFPEHGLILEVLVGRARAACWPALTESIVMPPLLGTQVGRVARSAEECC
jgi:GGDEF domain-containing protein